MKKRCIQLLIVILLPAIAKAIWCYQCYHMAYELNSPGISDISSQEGDSDCMLRGEQLTDSNVPSAECSIDVYDYYEHTWFGDVYNDLRTPAPYERKQFHCGKSYLVLDLEVLGAGAKVEIIVRQCEKFDYYDNVPQGCTKDVEDYLSHHTHEKNWLTSVINIGKYGDTSGTICLCDSDLCNGGSQARISAMFGLITGFVVIVNGVLISF